MFTNSPNSMKHTPRLIAISFAAALAATFSASAMAKAEKTKTFDEAVATLQADVAKNCGKGYNKKKFKLSTITGAYPETHDGLNYVVMLDKDSEFADDYDTLGWLKSKATEAQAKSLIGKKKCTST